MEHAFGSSPPFSLGIEEEFQLLSAESYELVPRFDEVADAAGDERVRQLAGGGNGQRCRLAGRSAILEPGWRPRNGRRPVFRPYENHP
jgi:hypothetical protein